MPADSNDQSTGVLPRVSRLRRVARSLWRTPERLLHPQRRRAALRRLSRRPWPRVVVVLCHGNICRSPYAAARLHRTLPPPLRDVVRIESAGFFGPGRACPEAALDVAAGRGVDLSRHRSRVVTHDDVAAADLIVVMDEVQRWAVRALFGGHRREVLVLGDLDPEPIETREIEDPVERPGQVFERTYSRIDRCVCQLVDALGAAAKPVPAGTVAPLARREVTT